MRRLPTLLAALAALPWLSGSARAADPVDPGAEAFDIRYYINDGAGDRIRLMSTNDLRYAINQARCECGQTIEAQVRLINTGTAYSQRQIDGFIGTQCQTAETSFNPQFRPCVRFASAQTQSYINGYSVDFGPIWLGSGIVGDAMSPRDPAVAVPAGACEGPGGQSGVWLCGYFDDVAGCQAEEFFITGTQHNNAGSGSGSGGDEAMGITFDYQAPLTIPEIVSALPGDGAVVMSWQSKASTDIYGYRVLCEEADTGAPAVEGVVDNPGLAASTYGTIYYTKENLCPEGPFSSQVGSEDPVSGTTGGIDTDTDGTDTDGTTTDGTTTDATTTDATTTDATTTDGTTTDGTGGDEVVSACPADRPATGICSLKWEYVCSGHIAAGSTNTGSTRIRGLENGKRYNLLLVGYDQAGNPLPIKLVENIEPVESNDLWEQCEADGNVCGDAGFCSVIGDRSALGGVAFALGFGLLGLGVVRRRRTRKSA